MATSPGINRHRAGHNNADHQEIANVDQHNETSGQNRRGVLKCMLWAGTGVVWTVTGGVPRSMLLGNSAQAAEESGRELSFVQISDSHIGFANAPNMDTPGTLREAIAEVNKLKGGARLLIHTGDVSHLSKDGQFDTAEQIIGGPASRRITCPVSTTCLSMTVRRSSSASRREARRDGTASTSRACTSSD